MDPKREFTSVDIGALVSELRTYEGAKVDKAYLYGDDLVRLKLRDFDRGRVELICEVGEHKRVNVADPERVPDAPGRPPDFARKLRSRIAGADFAGVEQYEFDRILEFHFERDDEDTRVIVELFGDGNVAVVDPNYRVIDCLETVRLKSRTVAPGSRYEFPESRVNPLAVDYDEFASMMNESTTDLVRTLATQLNFGGLYAEELCSRAGVAKTRAIEDAGDEDYEPLYDAVEGLATDLRTADLDPRIYHDSDDETAVADVTPFRLAEREDADLAADPFETFNAAADEYFHRLERAEEDEAPEDTGPDFEAEIEKRKRIIEQQENAIEQYGEQAEREREKAESLYANYDLVDEILSTVREARENDVPWAEIAETFEEGSERGIEAAERVVDVDGENGTVTVEIEGKDAELDPSTGVEKNANRLYKEAKRVEEKAEGAREAVEDTREELADLRQRKEEYESDEGEESGDADGDEDEEDVDWLSRPSIPVRESEEWYEQFRWFHTSDDYLVIGGRDADDNEQLVKKYLDKGDRFFHTQVQGGPATILKASDPSEPAPDDPEFPDSTVEEATQFAASYSSLWKEGKFAGDVYMVDHDQVSKTPESGEFLEKGGFAIRGDRTYFDDTAVGVAVGITCEPYTRVVGGPPSAIEGHAETTVRLEPGKYAQPDAAKRVYRELRERFADEAFVRKVASPDRIQHFLPPGGSRIVED